MAQTRGDKLVVGVALLAVSLTTRWLMSKSYQRATHHEPPKNPGEDGVSWPRALAWSGLVGIATAATRVATRRLISEPRAS